jgi:SpoVK/Ycf46/Vps4 family AAA+-type ATPase
MNYKICENLIDRNFMEQNYDREKRRQTYSDNTTEAKTPFVIKEPRFTLEKDVILPTVSKIHIEEAILKINHHKRIYIDWGFESVDPTGRGIVLNFYGKPGTGKTLTAEALAGTLKRPFLSLGIAEIESKFMGETSKNIQTVFELAKEHDAVIFFDEADTLLGQRLSSVTQGVDNEVNSMRSTMLIELERFEGIAIFATNFVENYDKAFESRISHHVHFELPDSDGRRLIWEKMLVPKIPLSIDRETLITSLVLMSEGFSGRDIRTCMRLSLPKIILEEQGGGSNIGLKIEHVAEAIEQIKKAKKEIGKNGVGKQMSSSEIELSKNLLGLNKKGEV